MNKNEFINKIVLRHSGSLTSDQISALQEDYSVVLGEEIDFDSLFSSYLQEYNFNVAPKPAWFVQRAKKKSIRLRKEYEIRDLIVYLKDGRKYDFAYEYPYEREQDALRGILSRFEKDDRKKINKIFRVVREPDKEDAERGMVERLEQIYI